MPRPLPEPTTETSRPIWEGAKRGELLLQHCTACDADQYYPRPSCLACGSHALELRPASGRGTVFSYAVAHRPTHPAFDDMVPMVIALVDLEEGPRMTTNIVDCEPGQVRIGAAVELAFEDLEDGSKLPVFRLAG
jgi:uncharacterized OB-fold protein